MLTGVNSQTARLSTDTVFLVKMGLKCSRKALKFKNFSGGACPQTPLETTVFCHSTDVSCLPPNEKSPCIASNLHRIINVFAPSTDVLNSAPSLTVSQIPTRTSVGALDVTIRERGLGVKRYTVAPTTMSSASKPAKDDKICVPLLLFLLSSRWESAWNRCFCPH